MLKLIQESLNSCLGKFILKTIVGELKMKKLLLSTFLICISTVVLSEDIELYISEAVKKLSARKQVLVIFDNSGSMRTEDLVRPDYDPDFNYPAVGGLHALSERFIYFTKGGVDDVSLPVPDSPSEARRFLDEINSCETARKVLEETGFYVGHIREYDFKGHSGTWNEIPDNNGANIEVLDCEDDVINTDPTNIASLPAGYPIDNEGDKKDPIYHGATSNVKWTGPFVTLYTDNYLRYYNSTTLDDVPQSRMEQAKEAITTVIKSVPSVDFGLQIFNYDDGDGADNANGGRIVFGIDELDGALETSFLDIIDNKLTPSTWTPLCESLYEASLYFSGKAIDFGNDDQNRSGYIKNKPPRDTTIESGGKYVSPFPNCKSTAYVILITDGAPTNDKAADASIEALTSEDEDGVAVTFPGTLVDSTKYSDNYLAALAGWMNKYDQHATLDQMQNVVTHTVGFGKDASAAATLLENTAAQGEGEFLEAIDKVGLTNALMKILNEIGIKSNDSLTSASVAANNFDRTETLNAVYYAMFDPETGPRWQGNLKKYKVFDNVQVGQKVSDAYVPALDEATGHFSENVTSYWSDAGSEDGDKVEEGGVADMLRKMKVSDRVIYSDVGASGSLALFNRTNIASAFTDADALATEMGVLVGEIDDHLNWAMGMDVDDEDDDSDKTDTRFDLFGDPLHSKPLVVNYGDSIRIVIGTNAGVLHMFEDKTASDTVVENWSFMPKEFLDNIKPLRDNYSSADKVYGIDGKITSYILDGNGDGIVNGTDKVWIFFGLRRGGSSYYALDITDPANPSLKWHIDNSMTGFTKIGQSWSQPKIAFSKLNSSGSGDSAVAKPVLFFAGGYDTAKDAEGAPTSVDVDAYGRAIYMVDADTKALLWSLAPTGGTTTFPEIIDSIPSSVSTLDSNADGFADRLYFGDTGGNLWRVDMPGKNPTDSDDPWTVFKLASLGGTTNTTDKRFFNEPSVVRTFISETLETTVTDEDGATTKIVSKQDIPYEAVLIGSGDRSNPLGTDTSDTFFMIKDKYVKTQSFSATSKPPTPTAIINTALDSDLYDFTDDPFGATLTKAALEALEIAVSKKSGWFIDLELSGEKSSATALVIEGVAYFTTFVPPALVVDVDVCDIPSGQGWLYAVDLALGINKYRWTDADNPEGITDGDERKIFISEQFLGAPTLIVLPPDDDKGKSEGNIIVGRKIIPVGFELDTLRTSLYVTEDE